MGRYKTVFSDEQENELVEYILLLENRLFDLTFKELQSLVYELAVQNNIQHPFNNETKLAGKDWLYGLLQRHKRLSLRSPEKTSIARLLCTTPPPEASTSKNITPSTSKISSLNSSFTVSPATLKPPPYSGAKVKQLFSLLRLIK